MINKEIAVMSFGLRTLAQVLYVALSTGGWFCLLIYLTPWWTRNSHEWYSFIGFVSLVAYAVAVVLMYEAMFKKPVVNVDRTKEPK